MKQIPRLDVEWLDPEAVQIVRALQQRKFTSYLVGRLCSRSALGQNIQKITISLPTRDPQEVKRAVPYCFIIGKRFRLGFGKAR